MAVGPTEKLVGSVTSIVLETDEDREERAVVEIELVPCGVVEF